MHPPCPGRPVWPQEPSVQSQGPLQPAELSSDTHIQTHTHTHTLLFSQVGQQLDAWSRVSRAMSLGLPSLCVYTHKYLLTYTEPLCTAVPASNTHLHTHTAVHTWRALAHPSCAHQHVCHTQTHICTVCTNAYVPTISRPACTHTEPVHTNTCTLTHICTPTHAYRAVHTDMCAVSHTSTHLCPTEPRSHLQSLCTPTSRVLCTDPLTPAEPVQFNARVHTGLCTLTHAVSHRAAHTCAHRAVHTTHKYTPVHPCAQCCAEQDVYTQI